MTAEPPFPLRLPADNHVHSEWSWDTPIGSSMDRACARAVQLGVPAVAFTEHVDFTRWSAADPGAQPAGGGPSLGLPHRQYMMPLDVEGYLAEIERCRNRYPGLRVITGMEAGEPHLFAGSLADVLKAGQFERVLGSLHSVRDRGRLVRADALFRSTPAHDVLRRYFAELLVLVEGSDAFGVLAHCDYPRRNWPAEAGPYDEADFEAEYRTVFRALAGTGRALEVNTRSPLASARLVRWWREEGGRAVSFGSDAHVPKRVGARFDLAVDVVEAAGFRSGRDAHDFWRA